MGGQNTRHENETANVEQCFVAIDRVKTLKNVEVAVVVADNIGSCICSKPTTRN